MERGVVGNRGAMKAFFRTKGTDMTRTLTLASLSCVLVSARRKPFSMRDMVLVLEKTRLRNAATLIEMGSSGEGSVLGVLSVKTNKLVVPRMRSLRRVGGVIRCKGCFPMKRENITFTEKTNCKCLRRTGKSVGSCFTAYGHRALLVPRYRAVKYLRGVRRVTGMSKVSKVFMKPCSLSMTVKVPARFSGPRFGTTLREVLGTMGSTNGFAVVCYTSFGITGAELGRKFSDIAIKRSMGFCVSTVGRVMRSVRG